MLEGPLSWRVAVCLLQKAKSKAVMNTATVNSRQPALKLIRLVQECFIWVLNHGVEYDAIEFFLYE